MGVPRKENAELRPIRIEDCDGYNNYQDYDLTESGDELNEHSRRISVEQLHPMRRSQKNKKFAGKTLRRYCDDLDTDGVKVTRNMGARKWRRVEHARIMMTFTDLDDICEDGSDIATPPTTAFDKLFADKENMKIWNEFCSKDEVEQRRILNGTSKLQPDTPTTSSGAGSPMSCSGKSPAKKPVRHYSPYSGSACFDRIDLKSRAYLGGKKVNWAFIDFLERQLRSVFRIDDCSIRDAEAVFIGHYPASADRLLAHIVAQWLGLSSQSITDPSTKERITEIRSRRLLIPPQTTLIDHLESRVLKKDIEFIPFSMRDAENSETNLDADTSFLLAEELDELNITAHSRSDSEEENSWEKIPEDSRNTEKI
uniref:R3H-assoc domain-containing protein n=1 Tax=Caenorhabditis japonica TaxID=281687 RepID=A0A8R1I5H1_CAEJA